MASAAQIRRQALDNGIDPYDYALMVGADPVALGFPRTSNTESPASGSPQPSATAGGQVMPQAAQSPAQTNQFTYAGQLANGQEQQSVGNYVSSLFNIRNPGYDVQDGEFSYRHVDAPPDQYSNDQAGFNQWLADNPQIAQQAPQNFANLSAMGWHPDSGQSFGGLFSPGSLFSFSDLGHSLKEAAPGIAAVAGAGALGGAFGELGSLATEAPVFGPQIAGAGLSTPESLAATFGTGGTAGGTMGVDFIGSDWAAGAATGATGGLLPTTAAGLTAANTAAEAVSGAGAGGAGAAAAGSGGSGLPSLQTAASAASAAAAAKALAGGSGTDYSAFTGDTPTDIPNPLPDSTNPIVDTTPGIDPTTGLPKVTVPLVPGGKDYSAYTGDTPTDVPNPLADTTNPIIGDPNLAEVDPLTGLPKVTVPGGNDLNSWLKNLGLTDDLISKIAPLLNTAAKTAPGLAALAYANSQGPGYDPAQLNSVFNNLGTNTPAYVKSVTDPIQQNIAAGYGDMLQSQGLRGIRGSSFGDTSLANYQGITNTALSDAGAKAYQGSLAAQGTIGGKIADLGVAAQANKNRLFGSAFNRPWPWSWK